MRISQFQKYSQRENTVTNNVLLMLSRLNDLNVNYYRSIIEKLNEGINYLPQASFKQQVGNREIQNGIVDGLIEVKASKIIIETKLKQTEILEKLVKYGKSFEQNSQNQLWHLSSNKFNEDEVIKIKEELKKEYPNTNIQFNNLLFSDLLDNLVSIFDENNHDMELKLLYEDFSDYCYESNLISNEDYNLLIVPSGFSFEWNKKYQMYFCPVNWHSQKFKYFGLYNSKSVRYISTVETVITADFDYINSKLTVYSKGHTNEQIERLKMALIDYQESQVGLKYYLFPENSFLETNFNKNSHGGIQGYRYKDLREFIDMDNSITLDEIARKLENATWN